MRYDRNWLAGRVEIINFGGENGSVGFSDRPVDSLGFGIVTAIDF